MKRNKPFQTKNYKICRINSPVLQLLLKLPCYLYPPLNTVLSEVCTRLSPVFALDWFKDLLIASAEAYRVQLDGSLCSAVPHTVNTSHCNGDFVSESDGTLDLDLELERFGGSKSRLKASNMVGVLCCVVCCAVLCCAVLCCDVLCWAELSWAELRCAALCGMLCSMLCCVLWCAVWYSMVWCTIVSPKDTTPPGSRFLHPPRMCVMVRLISFRFIWFDLIWFDLIWRA